MSSLRESSHTERLRRAQWRNSLCWSLLFRRLGKPRGCVCASSESPQEADVVKRKWNGERCLEKRICKRSFAKATPKSSFKSVGLVFCFLCLFFFSASRLISGPEYTQDESAESAGEWGLHSDKLNPRESASSLCSSNPPTKL